MTTANPATCQRCARDPQMTRLSTSRPGLVGAHPVRLVGLQQLVQDVDGQRIVRGDQWGEDRAQQQQAGDAAAGESGRSAEEVHAGGAGGSLPRPPRGGG